MTSAVAPGLIDTAIIVASLHGQPNAVGFLLAVNRLRPPEISQLSAMELLASCRTDPERANIRTFLGAGRVVPLTPAVVIRAVNLLETLPLPAALTPSDALIAATAIEHSLPLYTLDPTRFAGVPGLTAIQPY